ncbi:MAG: hypothetical protein OJF49_002029 [Ktedonobacterales bacterium]|jgi:hypothetical protein|nr:MAG: hypothetical protein OJF49_002029 [Ktedonobacterales bacterium]
MQDDDRQRRIEALRQLGADEHTSADTPTASATPEHLDLRPPRPPHKRRSLAVLGATVILVALFGAFFYTRIQSSPPRPNATTTNPALRLTPRAGLACISAPAWSPNGQFIAIIGTRQNCASLNGDTPDATQALVIFDAAATPIRQIPLAPFLPSAPFGDCTASHLALCYSQLLWSPDNQTVAMQFTTTSPDSAQQPIYNLLLVQADGSHATIIHGNPTPLATSPASATWALWDLHAHSQRFIAEPTTAQSLSWQSGGNLVAARSSTSGSPASAVGNPAGGASFTPWQPGLLEASNPTTFSADYWAWSPDGRYLATNLAANFEITTNASAQSTPVSGVGYTVSAPRDAALAALIADLQAHQIGGGNSAQIAWDTTGNYLLAARCAQTGVASLSVYATASGKSLATASVAGSNCTSTMFNLSWSPDSHHILLASNSGILLWTLKLA